MQWNSNDAAAARSLALVSYDDLTGSGRSKVHSMYEESFPADELVDFESVLLEATHAGMGVNLYGMVDRERGDDDPAGLACILREGVRMPGITYVLYLAIDPSTRGMGYGSVALDTIAAMYSDTGIALDIETVSKMDGSEDPADRANRLRRLHFYEKNGFAFTGLTFDSDFVPYDLMYRGQNMDAKDFDAMRAYFEWLEQNIDGFFF